MNRRFFIGCSLAAGMLASPGAAHDYRLGQLVINHPWTRATPPSARAAGGYLVIENRGGEADRLVGATFTRAGSTELHEMAHVNGVMRMREIAGGIVIPPGGKVELKPGGLHVMFMGLTGGLKEGESLSGTLVFEKAGTLAVEFKVEAMGSGGGHGHHHDHAPAGGANPR
jgi:copper(I)-binding protein